MSVKDTLGSRMKENYENRSKTYLTKRIPVIIRLDMRSGHSFTKGFQKPFDPLFMKSMQETMKYLCENVQGCVLGYTQSDEITLVLQDYKELTTEAFFDYSVQKICSITASMATLAFNKNFENSLNEAIQKKAVELGKFNKITEAQEFYKAHINSAKHGATFDARCFNIPKEEVCNCVLWRQLDAARNSVQMVGQSKFSHSELQGKSCEQIQEMLFSTYGINWNNLPTSQKRGSCCIRETQLNYHKLLKALNCDPKHPRILYVEVGDMPKEKVTEMLAEIKKKIESKSYDTESLKAYTNPGLASENAPLDSTYIPIHNGITVLPTVVDLGKWIVDTEIPKFSEDRDYIESLITFD